MFFFYWITNNLIKTSTVTLRISSPSSGENIDDKLHTPALMQKRLYTKYWCSSSYKLARKVIKMSQGNQVFTLMLHIYIYIFYIAQNATHSLSFKNMWIQQRHPFQPSKPLKASRVFASGYTDWQTHYVSVFFVCACIDYDKRPPPGIQTQLWFHYVNEQRLYQLPKNESQNPSLAVHLLAVLKNLKELSLRLGFNFWVQNECCIGLMTKKHPKHWKITEAMLETNNYRTKKKHTPLKHELK